MLIPIGGDQGNQLTRDGGNAGNLRDTRAFGRWDRSAKQLCGSASPNGQVGAVFLYARSTFCSTLCDKP